MTILEAIRKEGLSVRCGDKSLVIEEQGGVIQFVVYERKHRARYTTELVRTDDEAYAVKVLLADQ